MREVIVYYDVHGNIDEGLTYSKSYAAELKRSRTPAKSKSSKPSKSKKSGKGPFGLSWANPLSWILWIILLPFKLLWVIIKLALTFLTLGAISKYLKGRIAQAATVGSSRESLRNLLPTPPRTLERVRGGVVLVSSGSV